MAFDWMAAATLGSAGIGYQSARGSDSDARKAMYRSQRFAQENLKLGNRLDMANQKEMFDYRINQGVEAGMTPYEMYMGPAAGGGGGTSGSGQMLGNQASQSSMQAAQMSQQAALQKQQLGMTTATELAKTKMQTDAQKDVAKIQTGATERGQDIQKEIADNILNMDKQRFNQIQLPETAANLKIKKQELLKTTNQVATSDPAFQTAMKQLSMGPANLLVELTMRHHGIALNDKSFMALPSKQREAILQEILALSSSTYTEGKGAAALGGEVVDGGENLLTTVWNIIKYGGTGMGTGIKASDAPPSLGTARKVVPSTNRPKNKGPYRPLNYRDY